MSWTDEKISKLKKLWAKGMTTVEIGKILGVSKNAVVGKAHRLGLDGRPSPIKKEKSRVKPKEKAKAPVKAKVKVPVKAPAKVPTKAPTKVPTKAPAKVPTKAPAKVPVKAPAKVPTKAPAKVPTKAPAKVPTKAKVRTEPAKKAPASAPAPASVLKTVKKSPKAEVRTAVKAPEQKASYAGKIVTLLDLQPNSCRWPIGDPRDADFRFCDKDAIEGKPYCLDHCAEAYVGINKFLKSHK